MAKTRKETNKGLRLLNLETSQPEIGSPIIELIGMASSKLPNSASLKSKFVLIDGIREAHEAKQNPIKKKKILKDILCLLSAVIAKV